MLKDKVKKAPIPGWAWAFAVACFAIPVLSLGGAIPVGLGVGAGIYCLGVSREPKKGTRTKLIHCASATAGAWVLFIALAIVVSAVQLKFPGLAPGKKSQPVLTTDGSRSTDGIRAPKPEENPLASVEARQEIYAKATRMRENLKDAEDRKRQARRKGRETRVIDKQIEHIQGMHESQLEFTMNWYKITREQLEEVLAEGDRERWPTG